MISPHLTEFRFFRIYQLSCPQGAGFTREERQVFGIEGFLPYDVHSLEKQSLRAWNQLLKVRL